MEEPIVLRGIADGLWSDPFELRYGETPSASGSGVAAVELAADLVSATSLRTLRKRLLTGLVHALGMDAAAAWTPLDQDGGLTLHDHVGLPREIADALGRWPSGSLPDRLVRNGMSDGGQILVRHAPAGWDGRMLYIVALPEPAREVIGVFAGDGMPDQVMRLVEAIGRTYVTAVTQSYALRDNQRIIDAMVEELRPNDVALPPGYSIGHLYRSATAGVAIGGDLYDWFCTDRGDLGVAVGDVSGKGVQAASRTAMAVHSLRAFALPGASPHVASAMLNTVVSGRSSVESFLTLVYLRIDTRSDAVDFVLAGHPPPILLGHNGISVVNADADVPIGVDASTVFHLQHTALQRGETLLLYTDGVTEARAVHDGALLGMSGLVAMLEDLRGAPAQDIADGVWRGVQEYTGGDTTDDVAVVALQRDAQR
jgi:serine phosphatase RsbU (regulator of sigma subunit)